MTPSFLARLEERKLVQWALAYLAGAWVALQVFGELRDNFGRQGVELRRWIGYGRISVSDLPSAARLHAIPGQAITRIQDLELIATAGSGGCSQPVIFLPV